MSQSESIFSCDPTQHGPILLNLPTELWPSQTWNNLTNFIRYDMIYTHQTYINANKCARKLKNMKVSDVLPIFQILIQHDPVLSTWTVTYFQKIYPIRVTSLKLGKSSVNTTESCALHNSKNNVLSETRPTSTKTQSDPSWPYPWLTFAYFRLDLVNFTTSCRIRHLCNYYANKCLFEDHWSNFVKVFHRTGWGRSG